MKNDVIDWQLTIERLNGNTEAARDVLLLFLKELPLLKESINKAYQSSNLEKLYESLHRLHGGCCYVGVPHLKQATYQFCDAVKKRRLEGLDVLLVTFNDASDAVMHAAKDLVI